MRIAIVGIPGTGKSTLAAEMGGGRSTDDLMHLGWDEAGDEVSKWFDDPGPWIIEGVAVPRALRAWRERNPGQPPPVDKVIHLRTVHQQHPDAEAMGKGINTVLKELWPWLMTKY